MAIVHWVLDNVGWILILELLLWKISYQSWRLDHGGKTATEIWREAGHDV